jgi:hypothetical protein
MELKSRKLELTADQLARVAKAKQRDQSSNSKISPEWMLIAEFGYYFGWQAVKELRAGTDLTMDEVNILIIGARKVWTRQALDMAQGSFIGSTAARSKTPTASFKKAIKGYEKAMRVEL